MIELLLATRNAHKTREFALILGDEFPIRDLSAERDLPEIAETGQTFAENAILKAVAISQDRFASGGLVVADDSGLEVDALGGAPGVYSARYAGENATDPANVDKLLCELNRAGATEGGNSARFRCVLAVARGGNVLGTFEGMVEGRIVSAPRGAGGFGYDPIFVPNGFEQTFAELPPETKNRISHRARALALLQEALRAGRF